MNLTSVECFPELDPLLNNLGAHAVLVSSAEIPAGKSLLRFEFTPGAAFTGTGALFINAEKSAQGPLTISPAVIGFGALEVGRNSLSPVSQEYASKGSFAFPDGELKKVVVNVSPLAQTASVAASQPVAKAIERESTMNRCDKQRRGVTSAARVLLAILGIWGLAQNRSDGTDTVGSRRDVPVQCDRGVSGHSLHGHVLRTSVDVASAEPSTTSHKAPLGMVWVPGGRFWIGTEHMPDAQPGP